MKRLKKWTLVLALGAPGCHAIRPYEKEFLLHPLMDDATVSRLDAPLMTSQAQSIEKLGGGLGATGMGTSCPTCGG
jgi:hypothetical protein